MSEFLYNLEMGKIFLAETQITEAIKRKIQLYRTFKWQKKKNPNRIRYKLTIINQKKMTNRKKKMCA